MHEPKLNLTDGPDPQAELQAGEGFSVLTDIYVAATMKQKLGIDFRAYRIPGAWSAWATPRCVVRHGFETPGCACSGGQG